VSRPATLVEAREPVSTLLSYRSRLDMPVCVCPL